MTDRQTRALIQVECQQFLYRVTTLLDDGRWEELANCFTEDGVLYRPTDSENGIKGRQAILRSFQNRAHRVSCHILSNIYCDVLEDHKVVASSRVWLITGEANDSLPVRAHSNIMVGSFVDTLVRIDEQWLIQCRKGGLELKYTYD